MKKLINAFVAAFVMLAMTAGFASCDKDAADPNVTRTTTMYMTRLTNFIEEELGGQN